MKATHYRAYGNAKGLSRRTHNGQKINVEHDVEDVIAEGKLKNGVAEFDTASKISNVVFYDGNGDEAAVVGSLPVGKTGKISADSAELPEAEGDNAL